MEFIDITVALHDTIPFWPGSCGFKRTQVTDLKKGDTCNGSQVTMDCHTGTHVDARMRLSDKKPLIEPGWET